MLPFYNLAGYYTKYQSHTLFNNSSSIEAIKIRHCNIIFLSICPEDLSGDIVNSEGIWPAQRLVDETSELSAIHACFSDIRFVSPVCPVQISTHKEYLKLKKWRIKFELSNKCCISNLILIVRL